MILDVVGFHPSGGYLANGTASKFGTVNWVLMWPKMQAIDAYVLSNLWNRTDPFSAAIAPLNATLMAYFAADITAYGLPPISAAELLECGNEWIRVQNDLVNYYRVLGGAEQQLVFFDSLNHSTTTETTDYLKANLECGFQAIGVYFQDILAMNDPASTFTWLQSYIKALYEAGKCF
jgi:hypothetical protein